jgi:uncharacterized protein YjbI with pentapeptide repeats
MKGKRYLLIGASLGLIMGWALGFLRLPVLEKNHSFWIGFGASLALVLFIISLLFVWNKSAILTRLIGKKPTTEAPNTDAQNHRILWIIISVFILVGGLVTSSMTYTQSQLFEAQFNIQNKRIQEQSELIVSIRKGNLIFLMNNLLDKVDDELKESPNGILSDAVIARIAALGHSFKPYKFLEGDSLSTKVLSPERGLLLLALSVLNIDSSSFDKIKRNTTFSNADLSGANLKNVDLSWVNLKNANLKDADLSGTSFKNANLKGATLWGGHFNKANFNRANMEKADLRWAEFNEAELKSANLNGANLMNAKLRAANLSGTTFQWAKLGSTMFNQANLTDCNLLGANLTKANLTKTDLSRALLERVNLSEGILIEAKLANANVEKNWLKKLDGWQTIGTKDILASYKITTDTSGKYKNSKFQLERMED